MDGIAEITLDNLGGGALKELFEREWNRLLANVQDVNTEPEAKRALTIKIGVKPNETREEAALTIDVSASLAGPKTESDKLYMGMKEGKLVGVRYDPRQSDMFRPSDNNDVTPLPVRKEGDV